MSGQGNEPAGPTAAAIPIRIGYVGGGSRGWAHDLMHELAICPHLEGEVRLYDIDQPMARLNEAYGNWLQTHPQAASRWRYRAVPTLKACLTGADFVFLSIQPGPIEHMKAGIEDTNQEALADAVFAEDADLAFQAFLKTRSFNSRWTTRGGCSARC